jgi:hypothetical protein
MIDRNESHLIARERRNRGSSSDGGDHVKRAARRSKGRAAAPPDAAHAGQPGIGESPVAPRGGS